MFQVYVQAYNSSDDEDRIIIKTFQNNKKTSTRSIITVDRRNKEFF